MDLNSNMENSRSSSSLSELQSLTSSPFSTPISAANISPFFELFRERMRNYPNREGISPAQLEESSRSTQQSQETNQSQSPLNQQETPPDLQTPSNPDSNPFIPEPQTIFFWFGGNFRFLFLLFVFYFSNYAIGIFSFLWFTGFYLYARQTLRKQEYLKADREISILLMIFGFYRKK